MAAIVSQNFHLIQQRVVDHLRQKAPDIIPHWLGYAASIGTQIGLVDSKPIEFSPLDLPSKLVDRISDGDSNRFRKIAWLAPALGITLLTLGCHFTYTAIPYVFLKGVIAGVHFQAMQVLINIGRLDCRGDYEPIYKIITLNNVLGLYFSKGYHDKPADTQSINRAPISIDMMEHNISLAAAYIVSFVAAMWMVNPILTTTVVQLAQVVYVVVCNQLSLKSA